MSTSDIQAEARATAGTAGMWAEDQQAAAAAFGGNGRQTAEVMGELFSVLPQVVLAELMRGSGEFLKVSGVLKKYGALSHLWDFGVAQGPLAYAATHTAAEFIDAYPLWPLWQDTAGTVPSCKINDPIGLCLDKPTGAVALGPELVTTQSVSGAAIDGATPVQTYSVGANVVPSKTYKVSATVSSYAGTGDVGFSSGTFASSTGVTRLSGNGTMAGVIVGAGAAVGQVFTRPITNTCNFSNISVREIIGAHASQATTTKRPILSGRVNVLAQSHDATNAAWIKVGGTTAPNATTVNLPNFLEAFYSTYVATTVAGTRWTGSFWLSGSGSVYVLVARYAGGPYEETIRKITLTSTPALYQVTHTVINAQTGMLCGITRGADGTATSVTFGGSDLRPANSPINIPAYQRVTSASDYDTVGFPVRALFDGVDDCLVVPSLDLSMTDKVTVVAGATKLSDALDGVLCEHTAAVTSNNGAFSLHAPPNVGLARYGFGTRGIAPNGFVAVSLYNAPRSDVLSVTLDNSAGASLSAIKIRISGTAGLNPTNDGLSTVGPGNYASASFYIGQRAGTSLPFNGAIQSLAVIGNLLPDGEVQILETSANAAMGKVY